VRANTISRSAQIALVMKRVCPLRTDRARAQAARVGAGLGFGEGERGHQVTARQPRQVLLLLPLGAAVDQHLTGDAVVGAEHRAERRRGPAELHRQPDLLGHGEAETAVLLGDGIAEQPHGRGLLPEPVGDLVGLLDLVLGRDDLLADERADCVEDRRELVGLHGCCSFVRDGQGVERVRRSLGRPRNGRRG